MGFFEHGTCGAKAVHETEVTAYKVHEDTIGLPIDFMKYGHNDLILFVDE